MSKRVPKLLISDMLESCNKIFNTLITLILRLFRIRQILQQSCRERCKLMFSVKPQQLNLKPDCNFYKFLNLNVCPPKVASYMSPPLGL